ncbi:hypothetical protein JB92DRAFT_3070535 [Gautieria morchelliformis]|nr:hypothetical protein JB92DRAFT_3070535 [Gautieria morchelliformis]
MAKTIFSGRPRLLTKKKPTTISPDLVRRGDRWVINPGFFKQARYSPGRNPSDPAANREYYPLRHHQRAFDQLEQRNAWSIKTSPDLDLNFLADSYRRDRPDYHPPYALITIIILEIAIKRRFAYYANPRHAEEFSEDLSEVLSSHPWLTLTHQHPAGHNAFDDTDWWTVRFNRTSRNKLEFRRPRKTRSKQASRDSGDGWADASTKSLSGDDAKADGPEECTAEPPLPAANAAPPDSTGTSSPPLAAPGRQSPGSTPEIGRVLVRHQLPSQQNIRCPLTGFAYQKANR